MHTRWSVAVSAALICMVGFGSRGIFGLIYVEMLKEYPWSRAGLAGVYSVGMVLMGFGGALAGSFARRLGPKRFYLLSGVLVGATFVLTSFVQTLTQVYLTYGLLGGLSLAALGLGPNQGLVARWFETDRGLAIGIVAAGAGAYPIVAPLAQLLIESVGWRSGLVVLGILSFCLVAGLGLVFMREPPAGVEAGARPPEADSSGARAGAWTLRAALRTGPLWLIMTAWFFVAVNIHFLNTHLVAFLVGIGHPALFASGILAIYGALSAANRPVGGKISDHFGRVRTFIAGGGVVALSLLLLLSHRSPDAVWKVYAFAMLFGLGIGGQTIQTSALASDIYRGKNFGSILGFMTIGIGLGGGLGPWLGGVLFEATGDYRIMIGLLLLSILASSGCMIAAGRWVKKRDGRLPAH